MKTTIFYFILTFAIVLIVPALSFAAGDLPDEPAVPIDGGLSLLIAAGVAYVGKKGYDARKKKAEQDKEILP